jgi:hypothetical protein
MKLSTENMERIRNKAALETFEAWNVNFYFETSVSVTRATQRNILDNHNSEIEKSENFQLLCLQNIQVTKNLLLELQ